MRDLIGRYLDEQGRGTTYLLAGSALLFAVLVVAWALYALASTAWFLVAVNWTAWIERSPMAFTIAGVAWALAILWAMLAVAARELYVRWRDRRWAAEVAMDRIEGRLYSRGSKYLDRTRDRLALRGIEAIERRLLGAERDPESATDLALEERLIELEASSSRR